MISGIVSTFAVMAKSFDEKGKQGAIRIRSCAGRGIHDAVLL